LSVGSWSAGSSFSSSWIAGPKSRPQASIIAPFQPRANASASAAGGTLGASGGVGAGAGAGVGAGAGAGTAASAMALSRSAISRSIPHFATRSRSAFCSVEPGLAMSACVRIRP
jgi:hypothetical protein